MDNYLVRREKYIQQELNKTAEHKAFRLLESKIKKTQKNKKLNNYERSELYALTRERDLASFAFRSIINDTRLKASISFEKREIQSKENVKEGRIRGAAAANKTIRIKKRRQKHINSNGYITALLGLKVNEVTQEMIEIKRLTIQLTRSLKNVY